MLDQLGFENTRIVASDDGFQYIVEDMYKDAELTAAIDIIGWAHFSILFWTNENQLILTEFTSLISRVFAGNILFSKIFIKEFCV